MEFLNGIVALSLVGFWFWALATVIVIAAIVSVETEKFKVTTPVVIGGGLLLVWLSHFPLFSFVRENGGTIGLALLGYFVVGIIYGAARYLFWAHDVSDKLDEYVAANHLDRTALTVTQAQRFASQNGLKNFPLRIGDSKQHILFWMIYWPLSLPWTVFNQPVRRFFAFAYGRLAGILQIWVDRIFRNVEIVPDPEPVKDPAKKDVLLG